VPARCSASNNRGNISRRAFGDFAGISALRIPDLPKSSLFTLFRCWREFTVNSHSNSAVAPFVASVVLTFTHEC